MLFFRSILKLFFFFLGFMRTLWELRRRSCPRWIDLAGHVFFDDSRAVDSSIPIFFEDLKFLCWCFRDLSGNPGACTPFSARIYVTDTIFIDLNFEKGRVRKIFYCVRNFFPNTSRKIEKIYMDSEKWTILLEIRKDRLRIVRIIEDNLKIWVFI